MTAGLPFRKPDVQQLLRRAGGAGSLKNQRPEGSWIPAFTKVHARHRFSDWQGKLHSTAPREAVLL
jgi:hypothetical protein